LIVASERLALLIKEVAYEYQALADARVQCYWKDGSVLCPRMPRGTCSK
jgi:hypothetical protein